MTTDFRLVKFHEIWTQHVDWLVSQQA